MNPKVAEFIEATHCHIRSAPAEVDAAIERLGVTPPRPFIEFYRRYRGVFGSRHTAFELAELVGHAEELTSVGRTVHHFPTSMIVLSEEVADAVLVYDTLKDAVYVVDFEGSDQELKEGKLEPCWRSFEDFLDFYFIGVGVDEPILTVEQDIPGYLENPCEP